MGYDRVQPTHLKFGIIDGLKYPNFEGLMAASEVIKAKSANIVVRDGSGHFTIANATDAIMYGIILDTADETCSATAGATKKTIVPATAYPLMRIPVGSGTLAQTDVGKVCDLVVTSDIVGAAVDASTYGVLLILQVDLVNDWVISTFNPEKLTGYTGGS